LLATQGEKENQQMMNSPIAANYGWQSNADTCSRAYLLPLVAKICRKHATQKILDIGTGNGSALPFWQKQEWGVSAMKPDAEGLVFTRQVAGADVRMLGVGEKVLSGPLNSTARGGFRSSGNPW
jgi:hypothetical protein